VSVLSDHDIVRRIKAGTLGIDPFVEANLTPNGYDLSLAEVQPDQGPVVKQGPVELGPGTWFAVSTRERVRFPADLCGELWLRSSHIRKGVVTSFGRVDAGFEGNLTMTGYNASKRALTLSVGERYCQLVVSQMSSPAAKPYASRSGHFQGQQGITLDAFAAKLGADKAAAAKAKRKSPP
jgi:dCTP deaminase